jgi:hypothetical protein
MHGTRTAPTVPDGELRDHSAHQRDTCSDLVRAEQRVALPGVGGVTLMLDELVRLAEAEPVHNDGG